MFRVFFSIPNWRKKEGGARERERERRITRLAINEVIARGATAMGRVIVRRLNLTPISRGVLRTNNAAFRWKGAHTVAAAAINFSEYWTLGDYHLSTG